MVAMEWFSKVGKKSSSPWSPPPPPPWSSPTILGILCFETAKTMSSLISLYNSLSDNEVSRLRKQIIGSRGVSYLNSKDEGFLLSLAFWERLEELDLAANCAARLGRNCSAAFGLKRFDLVYADMKVGLIDPGKIKYGSKDVEKMIAKVEKYVSATSMLHSVGESLREMEISERKMKQWKKRSNAKLPGKGVNFDLFDEKIGFLRKQVKKYRESSLWNQTFDKGVALMARLISVIYVRLCLVFGSYISGIHSKDHRVSKSGPIPKRNVRMAIPAPRFHSQELRPNVSLIDDIGFGWGFGLIPGRHRSATSHMQPMETIKHAKVFQGASPLTVGGSGLTTRYANVILLTEKYLEEPGSVDANARDDLYQMLSENLRIALRSKLRKSIEKLGEEEENDEMLAEGWREGLRGILGWIGPMAHDTIQWQMQRNMEKQGFDAKPKVLLLQTLHYSDIVKTEAAIVELLVGLSYVCRYENRQ